MDEDYVAYHSEKRMGRPLRDGPPFGMLTSTSAKRLAGRVLWVIEGRGDKSKQYYLKQRFLVESVEALTNQHFKYAVSASKGTNFVPKINLSSLPWFKQFLHAVSNFSIGITRIKPEFQKHFEEIHKVRDANIPDNDKTEGEFVEGEIRTSVQKFRARSLEARQACIEHFGTKCIVCRFDFGLTYGNQCAEFIEVHHRNPVSSSVGPRVVRPNDDLVPLCPNCHRALHMLEVTVEELKQIWEDRQGPQA